MITLLTDFGLQDIYVGVMKGVIMTINPQVSTIDLCHQIPPHDIQSAAFQLASAYAYFPKRTVHLVVVDPGVGGARDPIALNLGDMYFVGPNNGVFSCVLEQAPANAAICLDNPKYWAKSLPSATFHGRDIFAPAAAYLSLGIPLHDLGRPFPLDQLIQLPQPDLSLASPHQGYIQSIDQFGNLITSLSFPTDSCSGVVTYHQQQIPLHSAYCDVPVGEAIALIGSHGRLEIAINQGSAQTYFGALIHDPVSFSPQP